MILTRTFSLNAARSVLLGLSLAGFCIVDGLLSVAEAQQPSSGVQMYDESGRPIGNGGKTAQVKVMVRVVDADTHQPLPQFYVTTGTQDQQLIGFDWSENKRTTATHGVFALTLTKARMPPAVLIEADGYLPQCSGPIRVQETNMTFLLKKGSGPTGVVLTPDGRPAAGRTVYLSRWKDLLYLTGPTMRPKQGSSGIRSTNTDAAGRFSFAPNLEAYAVVVADDAGFAQVRIEDLKASPEVRLQPWARVEGTLRIGAALGTNETMRLADAFAPEAYFPRPYPPCAISVETTTDGAGRFVFPRVPPVDVKVFHAPKLGRGDAHLVPITQITNLTLTAGETRETTLGGQGCPIVGRVVLKNYDKPIDWQDQAFWLESVSPAPPDCPNFDSVSNQFHLDLRTARNAEEKEAARDRYWTAQGDVARQIGAYYSSAAGRRYWFSKRSYVLRFSQDGSFHIDDVPGGNYELTLDVRELEEKRGQRKSPLLALHRQEIEVPDSPGGRSDTPLDLGVISLLAPLHPGDEAPDFAVKTADGQTVKLSDYKGKYVLLDFWATSSAPSVAEMPELNATYAAFGSDPRFAMVSLSLDTDLAAVRNFSTEHQIGWTQGFLGGQSESKVADQYGIESIPFVLLLDPAGRVLITDMHEGAIKSGVHVALTAHE
ncbi:MAG TPA: redoxin domain-containing protein [Verrucomicrobiae bacterium]|jgi:peroxiredoxin|nr:redoxin domain-containing protein [Verrucomicrobiae bacterium]